jgi:hypothetical protein
VRAASAPEAGGLSLDRARVGSDVGAVSRSGAVAGATLGEPGGDVGVVTDGADGADGVGGGAGSWGSGAGTGGGSTGSGSVTVGAVAVGTGGSGGTSSA